MWNKNFSPASAPQLRSENLSPAFALQVRRLIWKIKVYRSASLTCAQGPAPAPASVPAPGGETQPGFRARLIQAGTKPGCVLFPAPKHRFWPCMDPFRGHGAALKWFLVFPSGHIFGVGNEPRIYGQSTVWLEFADVLFRLVPSRGGRRRLKRSLTQEMAVSCGQKPPERPGED